VNNIIKNLASIGFSEYEAKAYAALHKKNPVTAYELSKASGIPTSKIYEVLSRLDEKGIVSVLGSKGTKRYIPLDADEFIEGLRTNIGGTLNELRGGLMQIGKSSSDGFHIWNINDYEYLMNKAERMVLGAQSTLLISAWKEEIDYLENFLKTAVIKGVRPAIIHFGRPRTKIEAVYQHPIEDTLFAEKGGRYLVVVADSQEALIGAIFDGTVEGAWSMNRGFVSITEDYIKHDIYIMKIVRRFDSTLRRMFGNRYEKMRDIFSDDLQM
jgi:sugar-specific transcriptional regulator TrmB